MYRNGPWSLTAPTIELAEVGYYDCTGSDDPASVRGYYSPSYSSDYIGFRVTLYL